jgi:hypothetical protein
MARSIPACPESASGFRASASSVSQDPEQQPGVLYHDHGEPELRIAFDASGKNLAPGGAKSVTIDQKTGRLLRFD